MTINDWLSILDISDEIYFRFIIVTLLSKQPITFFHSETLMCYIESDLLGAVKPALFTRPLHLMNGHLGAEIEHSTAGGPPRIVKSSLLLVFY